jgi:DNA-binding SARP family transcriptional activator
MLSMAAEPVRLGLLHAFSLRCAGTRVGLPATAQRLLAFLALQREPLPRSYVAAVLWPDATTDHASGSLRSVLWRLGRIHRRGLVVCGEELRLADHVGVDLDRAWASATELLDGAPAHGIVADDLAHDILPDWDYEWVRGERDRFRQARLHALETLSWRLAQEQRYGEAVGAAMVAVAADPLRETAHRALIGVYLAEGNHGQALNQYRDCHRLLRDELGMPPSPALETLIGQALHR